MRVRVVRVLSKMALLSSILFCTFANLRLANGNKDKDKDDAHQHHSIEELLEMGDNKLATNDPQNANQYYLTGIEQLNIEEDSLITGISLYTNLGTAHSTLGNKQEASKVYRDGLLLYSNTIDEIVHTSHHESIGIGRLMIAITTVMMKRM